jgi:glycosyltransferase involved in cell wall biosynthesis
MNKITDRVKLGTFGELLVQLSIWLHNGDAPISTAGRRCDTSVKPVYVRTGAGAFGCVYNGRAVPISQNFSIPNNERDFEEMCLELLRRHWNLPGLQLYGKRGERQSGVDILDLSGETPVAAQCKLKEQGKKLSAAEIQVEVEKAISFDPRLSKYAILTTGTVSTGSQKKVLEINQSHKSAGLFTVEVLNWEGLCALLRAYPEVRQRFYGDIDLDRAISIETQLLTIKKGVQFLISQRPDDNPDQVINVPAGDRKSLQDTLTIIISVYNESRTLRTLVKTLKAEGLIDRYRIILCDDGSTDTSFEVMQRCCSGLDTVTCIRNRFNTRKVGAILRMAEMVRTPFVFTLDADSVLYELQDGALDALIRKMSSDSYSVAYFRILPAASNWFERLQAFDYLIFTDSIRRVLGVPVCLVGQGALWKTDSLLSVLKDHSGEFDGDDLENTVIALAEKMGMYWDAKTIVVSSKPKRTVLGLLKQRALSWDFSLLRVLLLKPALGLGGESGAFYKNVLLMDLIGHPFRLLAIPVLLPMIFFSAFSGDSQFYGTITWELYRHSVRASFKYGSLAIGTIWIVSVINSFICVRGRILSTMKWAAFNAVYLASPFIFVMYYGLVRNTGVSIYDLLGSSVYWLETGLLLTYLWWVLVGFFLLMISSLQYGTKRELMWSVVLAPMYFFLLMSVCRTIGICKYLGTWMFRTSSRRD